jgi:hypothetical protein
VPKTWADLDGCSALALLTAQVSAEKPLVLEPAGGQGGRRTPGPTAGRAEAPPDLAVTW